MFDWFRFKSKGKYRDILEAIDRQGGSTVASQIYIELDQTADKNFSLSKIVSCLSRLESHGYLHCRTVDSAGASRKIYSLSSKAVKLLFPGDSKGIEI